eukprot:14499113-Alexandrium_andersonii.AAC.1
MRANPSHARFAHCVREADALAKGSTTSWPARASEVVETHHGLSSADKRGARSPSGGLARGAFGFKQSAPLLGGR